jgi:hypothetical protein
LHSWIQGRATPASITVRTDRMAAAIVDSATLGSNICAGASRSSETRLGASIGREPEIKSGAAGNRAFAEVHAPVSAGTWLASFWR